MYQIAYCGGPEIHCEGTVFQVEGSTVIGTNTSFEKSSKFYKLQS